MTFVDDILYDHKWQPEDTLGLEHQDRRPNKLTAEKAMVIR